MRADGRYNELKALLKTAAAAAAEQAEPRDDARHIRAVMNRRLTPPPPGGIVVRARARPGRRQSSLAAARAACRYRIAGADASEHWPPIPPAAACSAHIAALTHAPRPAVFWRSQDGGGDLSARFTSMLEADLERAGKFVALQVEDIQLRARALSARAAAANTPAEFDRIEGAW